jgi:hypothetical protein
MLKIMAAAHLANNLDTWPVVILTPIGIGTIIAGMSFAENNRLPGVKGMPARAVLAIGAALLFRDTVGGPKNVLSFKFWIRRFAAR